MFQSLLIKGAMLVATIVVVLWIGWPVLKEELLQAQPEQSISVQVPATPPVVAVPTVKAVSKVNLNRASADELQVLPGIGPVLAQRMVDWRKAHGRYRTVDDLQEVKGIGKKRLEQLRPLVTVLTRIMYDGSSRNHAVASRDGRVETGEPEAYLKQYVEGASGEPARLHAISCMQACRSSESVIAAEVFMHNAGPA
ncbi:MAG: helix-hairpin-helix domain-containing protein [Nitrospiraceae bacterium]|nr:helix-hairpin-helix domain-containing protein [Nitrospiraceae bacterium]